jgi:hypothetical protein
MTLRLLAEDAEDLKIISAALQDAVAKIGDITYEPAARRLTLACNRFRWEAAPKTPRAKGGERVRAALQLSGVAKVQGRGLRRDAPDALISLLAITFEPSGAAEDPSGVVVFQFAGHGDLRVEVECIDALLADVSAPWPTPRRPGHD